MANLDANLSTKIMERFLLISPFDSFNILAATVGIKVTEIKTEIKTETDIAIPISLNNCPIGRLSNKIGIKTTTVVRAEPRIGAHTCREPL